MLQKLLKKHPILIRFALFIVIPIVLVFFVIYGKMAQSVVDYSGAVHLQGLTDQVQVSFDAQGTPSVVAKTDADAYFMQGYLHASERMWQMELQRRTVQGRLSEAVGRSQFPTDIWMRTLGLRPVAEKAWDKLGDSAKGALTAYADGVNAWIAQAQTLPPEFLALDITPEPWHPIDSLAWQKVLALNLGLNMYREMERLNALKVIPAEPLKVFYPHDPDSPKAYESLVLQGAVQEYEQDNQPLLANALSEGHSDYPFESFDALSGHIQSELGLGMPYVGSNAWAVSGQYTQSGNAMLANDPHLTILQELPWYSIQLKGDKLDVTGMSFVGIPGVAMGRNRDISWGTVSLLSDQQDLFYLDELVTDGDRYVVEQDGVQKELDITVDTEVFDIKADAPQWLNKEILPVNFEIRRTPMGPIVSDAVRAPDATVVLRWAALDHDDRSFEAFHLVQYAQDWGQFRHALSLLKAPGLHFVYADAKGNVGSQVAGHIPIRGKGLGLIPQRLKRQADMWQGYVPFEQLPSTYNPPEGYVVAANAKIPTDYAISYAWASDARYRRIEQLLQQHIKDGTRLTIGHMVAIQNDKQDLDAKTLLPHLTSKALADVIMANADPDEVNMARDALAQLSSWDTTYTVDSVAATIYESWVNELKSAIFNNEFNSAYNNVNVTSDYIISVLEKQMAKVLEPGVYNRFWCNDKSNQKPGALPCQTELINSFFAAIESLEKEMSSDDVEDWIWSQNHKLRLQHAVFATVMEKPFTKEVATGGALNTINLSLWVNSPTGGYQKSVGASFRHVFDLGKKDSNGQTVGEQNTYVIPTGQSGHFLSDHYNDQTAAYIAGQTHYYHSDSQRVKLKSEQPRSVVFTPRKGG